MWLLQLFGFLCTLNVHTREFLMLANHEDRQKMMDVFSLFEEEQVLPRANVLRYAAKVLESAGEPVPFKVPLVCFNCHVFCRHFQVNLRMYVRTGRTYVCTYGTMCPYVHRVPKLVTPLASNTLNSVWSSWILTKYRTLHYLNITYCYDIRTLLCVLSVTSLWCHFEHKL